ncbi:MAG: zinc ribbon domain-containing protein [Deltaproteobacteria bacterium]|nr:zinc ribbon domain-containing protein [Deltaproteobacteria bacterium]
MAFETKEEILEKLLGQEKPSCPHCNIEMNLWDVPPVTVGDGLGWGEPYLYICFNDECPMYKEGWNNMRENYGRNSSYRCMRYPGQDSYECIPVFSPEGATGQIIDDQVVLQQEVLKEATKRGFSILADCFVSKDGVTTLSLLIDAGEPARVRVKAAEIIGDIGSIDAIEPLQSAKFGNQILQQEVEKSIQKIHKRHFTRECPFCAEIIKERAKVCKHCGKEVAGL